MAEDTRQDLEASFPPLGLGRPSSPPPPSTPTTTEAGWKLPGSRRGGGGGDLSGEGRGRQTLADVVRRETPSSESVVESTAGESGQEVLGAKGLAIEAIKAEAVAAAAIHGEDGSGGVSGGGSGSGVGFLQSEGGGGEGGGRTEVPQARGWSTNSPIHLLADQKAAIKTLIVDTNAIVKGVRLERLGAEDVVTVREVLEEVRDREARRMIATLPFDLRCREPSDESLREMMRFARLTGDLHSLSATDVKLLALAHTLEVEAHGADHLNKTPPTVRVQSSRARIPDPPGWGDNVPNLEDWEGVDASPSQKTSSRILPTKSLFVAAEDGSGNGGQPASVDGGAILPGRNATPGRESPDVDMAVAGRVKVAAAAGDGEGGHGAAEQGGPADGGSTEEPRAVGHSFSSEHVGEESAVPSSSLNGRVMTGGVGKRVDHSVGGERRGDDGSSSSKSVADQTQDLHLLIIRDEDGEWERAVGRSTRRKYTKRAAARAAATEAKAVQQMSGPVGPAAVDLSGSDVVVHASAQAVGPSRDEDGEEPGEGGGHARRREDESAKVDENVETTAAAAADSSNAVLRPDADRGANDRDNDFDAGGYKEREEREQDEEDGSEEGVGVSGQEEELFWGSGPPSEAGGYEEPAAEPSFQSSVACMTLDFSMQNVLLQMGLRLLTVDGVRIKQVHRWALKCHACGLVTYEVTRLFCAKCGNGGTLNKVSVSIGPDGATHVAVRRRINVRGTRYSLPLPKGGREGASKNPILREDQLPERCRSSSRRDKGGVPNVFAPEYGPDTWFLGAHKKKQPPSVVNLKGVASMLTGRRNPNERRVSRKR